MAKKAKKGVQVSSGGIRIKLPCGDVIELTPFGDEIEFDTPGSGVLKKADVKAIGEALVAFADSL